MQPEDPQLFLPCSSANLLWETDRATKAAATPSSLDSLLKTSSLFSHKYGRTWTSLVAQWIRICLSMLGTWVQFLVREVFCGATKLAVTIEPTGCKYWSPCTYSPCSATRRSHHDKKSMYCHERRLHLHSLQLETARTWQQRPSTTTNGITSKFSF